GQGRTWSVVADHRNPRRLYVGTTRGGMFRSDDAGATWQKKSEGLYFQEVSCVVQHPTTGELYAGTRPASIFKSADYGESWSILEGLHRLDSSEHWTFPHPPFFPHVKAIGLAPGNPKLILGAIEEGWLVRSTDGGATWTNLADGPELDSHTVYAMPDNEKHLVSTSGNGIYRSEDGGDHFAAADDGVESRYLAHLAFHAEAPNILFTAGAEVPPPEWRRPEGCRSQFYRSEDQGRRWQALKGGLPNDLRAAPRVVAGDALVPGWVMVGMQDGDLWLSQDFGDSFRRIASGLPALFGLTSVAA
ncbi:MAG: WD40/YVTN/BNR-like repeat-containing protein, partial [Stellaceae bacterium]